MSTASTCRTRKRRLETPHDRGKVGDQPVVFSPKSRIALSQVLSLLRRFMILLIER